MDQWRTVPNPSEWQVTPETARLLQHWRHHKFSGVRPFFCQVEAVETAIWLTEVAPAVWASGQAVPRASCRRQQRRQSRTDAPRPEARHRRGQDHRHGDAHRVADHQRRAPARQQALHARLSRRAPRPDDQRPPARPPAERPRQLLRQPRAGPRRHAGRRQPGEDRHHQLPRLQASRDASSFPRAGDRLLQGRRRRAEHARNRRPDAPAGHARPHGHEEHPRAQRRGSPLLPRKARRSRRRRPEGRREEGGREEQRSRPALDFRPGSCQPQARPQPRHRSCRRRRSFSAAPAMPKARCSRGR